MKKLDLIDKWIEEIDYFKEQIEERMENKDLLDKANKLIGVNIKTNEELVSEFLNSFRQKINAQFSIYDECLGIPSRVIGEYILGSNTIEYLEDSLVWLIQDIIKQYKEVQNDEFEKVTVANNCFNKTIFKQLANCYLLDNEINDFGFGIVSEQLKTFSKNNYYYSGNNGFLNLIVSENQNFVSIKYSRS